ncbi:MAG: cupin domain-containing protein [Gammaproteobacteria bacterium]|jgi:uncharacterized cupin superfamily protein
MPEATEAGGGHSLRRARYHPAMIHRLTAAPTGAPETYHVAPEKRVSGDPEQRLWSQYTDASGKFFAGVWESDPGAWRIRYTEEEHCRILEGKSRLIAVDGTVTEVVAGDEFVIPRGFEGVWEVVERTRKTYVIYEANP